MKGLILICLFFSCACSKEIRIREEEMEPDIYYTQGSFSAFTGKCLVTAADGERIIAEFTYQHGHLEGQAVVRYPNGRIRKRGNFKQGELSGTWEFWDAAGNKSGEYKFDPR